ncbi:MAG: LysM peptidoglycan-binding domain-containing protein [Bacteroidia bacterium]|nr:LysM peptidoglycan-binding domain-containing protein [Bacteroidia bacterium]
MALVSALNSNKALAKLTIIPFKITASGNLRPASGLPFVAMYNPSSLSSSHSRELVAKYTSDGLEGKMEPKNMINDSISVELFLDATGASPAGGFIGAALSKTSQLIKGVDALIALFFSTCQNPVSDTHEPNFLRLIWGAGLFFEGYLESATVTYNLFGRDGRPIRATIKATFRHAATDNALAKIKNFFSSPDVTKEYIVKAGDTIYNIANRFYEDESFYLQIAETNDLKNYRRLVPGTKLILPPVQKTDA